MPPKVSIIVAHDDQLGIGANNRLLWHIKKDLKRFKKLTLNHPIIMGRKTYQTIAKPLPLRTNIIVSRNPRFRPFGCFVVDSLLKAIDLAKTKDSQEIFIIGGADIYHQALAQNLVDKLYLTHVKGDYHAQVFFPAYPQFTKIVSQSFAQEGQYSFKYIELEKSL